MEFDESLSRMPGNQALVPLAKAETLGNEGLVPFFNTKVEVTKEYFVCMAGQF